MASSSRELRRFVDVPWRLHDVTRHAQWVPPLRMAVRDALDTAHPFWRQGARALFIAERDGAPVGRIAAIENRAHNAFSGDRTGFFGFFECAEDADAARALLDAAGAWLAARGLTTMQGPMHPSTNYECGLLVDGFEHHPMFMTSWNPPYVPRLLEEAGLHGVQDLLGWHTRLDGGFTLPPAYVRVAERARATWGGRVQFRELETRHFAREIAALWDVYNAAWERNWGFVPMTRAEFEHLGKDLKSLVDTRFAIMAEVDGAPVGFALAIPDYHEIFKRIPDGRLFPTGAIKLLTGRRALRTVRVLALGIRNEHRMRGVFALLVHDLVRRLQAAGMTDAESSWVLADNVRMNRPMESMGSTAYRRWRIYERALTARGNGSSS